MTPDGREPDLPEGVSLLWLADPGQESSFGLFDVDASFEGSAPVLLEVSAPASAVIDSAKGFPPALALTRDDMARTATLQPDEFVERYTSRLREHLGHQRHYPFLMAEARVDELGYKSAGAYYWIVAFDRDAGVVPWVSGDYWIYRDPVDHFVLEDSDLARLPERPGFPENVV